MVMYKIFGDFLQEESPDYEGLFLEPTLRCNHLPFSYAIRDYILIAWRECSIKRRMRDMQHFIGGSWKFMYWFHWYSAPDQWFNYLIDLPKFVKSFSSSTYGGTVWSPLLSKPVGRPHEVLEMTKQTHSDCMEIKEYFVGLTNLGSAVLCSTSDCLSTVQLMKKMNW